MLNHKRRMYGSFFGKLSGKFACVLLILCLLTACTASAENDEQTLLIAAAASLEPVLRDAVIPAFEKEHPHIKVYGTYASSGVLRWQIEAGLHAEVLISASTTQVDALCETGLVLQQTPLLQNEIVLIVPAENPANITSLQDLSRAKTLAIGDPDSVPAGRYAKEGLESLGLWEEMQRKLSLSTDATQLLAWVTSASTDAALVYKSDALRAGDAVHIVCTLEDLPSPIVYPAALLQNTEPATLFYNFLQTPETADSFAQAGFRST